MRTFMKYGAMLIATYLAVAYATGTGTVITSATEGSGKVIRAFQGR